LAALAALDTCFVGVLTGNMPISAKVKLEHFRLESYFDFGVYGDGVHHRPDLRDAALQAVERRCGGPIATEQVVIIGDTPLDIALAQAMGSRCLAVGTGGFETAELVDAGADLVLNDLRETTRILEWLRVA